MVVQYQLIEKIILIEVIIVLLILASTLLLKFFGKLKTWRDEKETAKMVSDIKMMIETNFYLINSSKGWRRLDLLIPIIYQSDTNYPTGPWLTIREKLLDEQLLPIARVNVKSKKWLYRFFAAECFELKSEASDEVYLNELLHDPIRLIHLYASLAAIKFGSPTLIDLVLCQMAKERRHHQAIHLYIFERISKEKLHIIADRLSQEENIYVPTVCYKLLTSLSYRRLNINVTSDMESRNLDLKIAALKYLAFANPEEAKNVAATLLSDTMWETRSISLQVLSQLKAESYIDNITMCLRDPIWWVRLNAAKTLLSFGERGKEILLSQDPNIDRFAYETAQFALQKTD